MKVIPILLIFLATSTLRKEEACKTSTRNASPGGNKRHPKASDDPRATQHLLGSNEAYLTGHDGGEFGQESMNADEGASHVSQAQAPQPYTINWDGKDEDVKDQKLCKQLSGNQAPDYDLAIAGGGPMAAIVIARLSRSTLKKTRVAVLETKLTFATGVPYDSNIVNREHLMHVFSPKQVTVTGGENDFNDWINGKETDSPIWRDYASSKGAPQRMLVGKYLRDRFDHFVAQCEKKNYIVQLMPQTTAGNISAHSSGCGYVITSNKAAPVHTHNVFLATGHFSARRLDTDPEDYRRSPWPAKRLLRQIKEDDIGILGDGGLQSIDTILTFAHKYGKFEHGDTEYTPGSTNFKLTLYSRGGHLPTIHGNPLIYKPRHMIPENIDAATEHRFGTLLRLLKQDIVEILPPSASFTKNTVSEIKPKVFFNKLDQELNSHTDPTKDFLENMNNKPNIHFSKLQAIFYYADPIFRKSLGLFSAEEYVVYKKYIAPRIREALTRLPVPYAIKMSALIGARCLFLEPIGDDSPEVTERKDGPGVTVTYGSHEPVHHRYFIDATEHDGYIGKDTRQLTQSLLDTMLAVPYLFRFNAPTYASFIYGGFKRDGFDPERIVEIRPKEEYYYKGDGVLMDLKTMQIRPGRNAPKDGSIYAGAPFTFGYYPNVQTLPMAVAVADTAVQHMETSQPPQVPNMHTDDVGTM